ncbi:hypothetical protein [Haloferax sp. DFSO52]|uniref:hypothetical protein n=1 Tax=Haloferax sp. DFSO52 TaxID=3388505 RepID=UPI003A86291B
MSVDSPDSPQEADAVEKRLEDALERVAHGVKSVLTGMLAIVVGTTFGLVVYALAIRAMGVAPVERRLVASLVGRYRAVLSR